LLSVKAPCVCSKLKGMTPLHIACKNELLIIVSLLLKEQYDPNTPDK